MTMELEFVSLTTPESLAEIRAVAAEVWPRTFAEILSPEQIKYMMNMMYSPEVMTKELAGGMHFDLLKIAGQPAGYVVYSAYDKIPGAAKLHKVYLKHQYHGAGIGQKMLDHAQNQCQYLGFKCVILAVNKQNERAIKAYKRNGFKIMEAVCVDIGNGFFMDDYIMRKDFV